MRNFQYYAHCIELNCNFTIWLKVIVNSSFRRINLGSTSVTGGVTQANKADKRSQRQAVTAFLYYYHTTALSPPHHTRLTTTFFSLQKQLYPFSRLFNCSNLFRTSLTSPSPRAILLLVLAKTNSI